MHRRVPGGRGCAGHLRRVRAHGRADRNARAWDAHRARRRAAWPAHARRAGGLRQRRHRDAPARRIAGRTAFRQRAGRRRVPVAEADGSGGDAAGADGCLGRDGAGRGAAAHDPWRRSASRNRFRKRGRERAGQVRGAAGGPVCRRPDTGARVAPDARLHRTDARGLRRGHRVRAGRSDGARRCGAPRHRCRGPRGLFLGRVPAGGRDARPGFVARAAGHRDRSAQQAGAAFAAGWRSRTCTCAMRRCMASRCRTATSPT